METSVSESVGNFSVCLTTLLLTNDAFDFVDLDVLINESSVLNLTVLIGAASGTAIGN